MNHNKFLEDFWNTSQQNLKKLAHFFKNQSISIHAINSHGQQETVSVPSNSLQQQNYIISFGIQLMQRHLLAFYKVVEQRDNAPLNTFKTHYCMLNILLLLNTVYRLVGMLIFFKRPQQCLLMMGSPETVCQKLLKYTFRWRRVLQEKIDPRHTPVIPKTPLSTNKPVKMKKNSCTSNSR